MPAQPWITTAAYPFSPRIGFEQAAKAPSRVVLYARDGKNDLDLTEDKVHLGTGGAAVKILDLETGQPRSSTLKDLYEIGRLVDGLDHIHFFLRPCIPTDIPESEYDVNMFYACLKATGKHVMSGVNDEAGLERIIEMAAMLAGGKKLHGKAVHFDHHLFFHFTAQIVHPVHPHHAGLQPPGHSRGPVGRAHVGLHQPHDHGRHPGPAACRAAGRHHHLPADPTRRTAALRRHPGHGQHGHHGLSGGGVECGMMNAAIHQLAAHIQVPNYNSAG
jgi:trimethylamine--corrinoid protein Co-methyltransferase